MSTMALSSVPDSQDRLAATIAHAGTVVAWIFAPLLVYLVLPRSSQWARFHALQSLLWSLVGTGVSLATCGLAIPVFLVWHLVAAVKTMGDGDYEYPLVGKFAHDAVYGQKA
jgi:uncharacterized membrane protein